MTPLQPLRGRRIGGDAPASLTSTARGGLRAAEDNYGSALEPTGAGRRATIATARSDIEVRGFGPAGAGDRPCRFPLGKAIQGASIPNPRGRTSPIGSRGPSRGQAVTPRSDLPPAQILGRIGSRIRATTPAAIEPKDTQSPASASLAKVSAGAGVLRGIGKLLRSVKEHGANRNDDASRRAG